MNIKQTKEGWWVVDGDTHLSKWIEESGRLDHAPWLAEMACAGVPEDGIIIDAGSLYGDHAFTYSNKVPKGKVLAFEPGELAFECLKRNMGQFHHLNVCCHQLALSDKRYGKFRMNENENLGMSHCVEDALGTVLTTMVDDLALARLDLLKVDCEGFEYKILLGAIDTIKRCKPAILLEINEEALRRQASSTYEVLDLLHRLNYDWKICQPQCSVGDPQYDILAKPKT